MNRAGGALFVAVSRLDDRAHGVMVIDARHPRAMQSMVLAVDDWRAIVADVLEACALAERPGQCPDDVGAA